MGRPTRREGRQGVRGDRRGEAGRIKKKDLIQTTEIRRCAKKEDVLRMRPIGTVKKRKKRERRRGKRRAGEREGPEKGPRLVVNICRNTLNLDCRQKKKKKKHKKKKTPRENTQRVPVAEIANSTRNRSGVSSERKRDQ